MSMHDYDASFDRIVEVLKEHLTKEEWVAFGDALDSTSGDGLLDRVNAHLEEIAPEVFL